MSSRRRWTDKDYDRLAIMVSEGKSQRAIAKALKTSVSSLNRHFGDRLKVAPGRPAQQFTDAERAQAIALGSYGVSLEEIAGMLGVSKATVHKHLGDEIRAAPTKANAAVARSLYRKAVTDGDVNAQKYWLKNRAAGWEDRVSIDASLGVSGTVDVEHSVLLTDTMRQLSPAGRDALRIVLAELQEAKSMEAARDVRAIDAA